MKDRRTRRSTSRAESFLAIVRRQLLANPDMRIGFVEGQADVRGVDAVTAERVRREVQPAYAEELKRYRRDTAVNRSRRTCGNAPRMTARPRERRPSAPRRTSSSS